MRIDVVTLFPEVFESVLHSSILGRAIDSGLFSYHLHDLRQFGLGKRRQVDDIIYGGGAGMLLMAGPLEAAVQSAKRGNPEAPVILLSAAGKKFVQATAQDLSHKTGLILVCGRYEGVDERIIESCIDLELSTGDAIMTGGEIPALAVIDSVVRLLPGVLGDESSSEDESFTDGQLEYPQYTRPETWNNKAVPPVLLSGNHAEIEKWRREAARNKTAKNRPDLLS